MNAARFSRRRIRRADLRTRCLARGNSICPASICLILDTRGAAQGEIKYSAEFFPSHGIPASPPPPRLRPSVRCHERGRFGARRQHPRQRGVPYRLPRLENASIQFNPLFPPPAAPLSLNPERVYPCTDVRV